MISDPFHVDLANFDQVNCLAPVANAQAETEDRVKSLLYELCSLGGYEVLRFVVTQWLEKYLKPTPPSYWESAMSTLCWTAEFVAKHLSSVVLGYVGVPWLGAAASGLVPWAMSLFGKVVPGVGTFHAKGGTAATLQWLAATLKKPIAKGVGSGLTLRTSVALF